MRPMSERLDRCDLDGTWRLDGRCPTCEAQQHRLIVAEALPPYTHYCHGCGARWEPPNARGKTRPTEASMDLLVEKHWKECRG